MNRRFERSVVCAGLLACGICGASTFADVTRCPAHLVQATAAALQDRRLQLWAVGINGQVFSTWKTSADPRADWAPWVRQ